MAYSLSIRSTSKADALTQITSGLTGELTAGTATQAEHDLALAAVTALIGEASEPPEGLELAVGVIGSVAGYYSNGETVPSGMGFQCSVAAMPPIAT